MLVTLDTTTNEIIYNGKTISVNLINAIQMAPIGTMLEVTNKLDNLIDILLHLPKNG